jgi:polyhydroxyalkanoate synthesis regulator phasin
MANAETPTPDIAHYSQPAPKKYLNQRHKVETLQYDRNIGLPSCAIAIPLDLRLTALPPMNNPNFSPDALLQLAQKGFRVGIGMSATIVEGLQNPQRYQATLTQLQRDPNQAIEDLAAKGAVTEQEARKVVDGLIGDDLRSVIDQRFGTRPAGEMTVTTTAVTIGSDTEAELQKLTQQLSELRQALQQLQNQRQQSNS